MAIPVVAGEPLETYLKHVAPGNVPVTGETFTVVHALAPDGRTFTPVVTELGNGTYKVVAPTERDFAPGTYYIEVQASSGDFYSETFDLTRTQPVMRIEQAMVGSGSTRAELRRAVAAELGDLVMATATRDATTDTLIDDVHLARETRHFNGMQLMCVEGDERNIGKVATVTASSGPERSVTFTPALPAMTVAGDVFELVNRRGMGWTFDQYNRAINVAIQRAGEQHAEIPYSEVVTQYGTWRSPEIVIPDAFTSFSAVVVADRFGQKRKVPQTDLRVDRYARTVTIRGNARKWFHSPTSVTVQGYVRPAPLETDYARTSVPMEWLIVEVKAELESHDVTTGMTQGMRDRLYNLDRGGADGRRVAIIGTRAPNTVRLGGVSGHSTDGARYGYAVYAPEEEA